MSWCLDRFSCLCWSYPCKYLHSGTPSFLLHFSFHLRKLLQIQELWSKDGLHCLHCGWNLQNLELPILLEVICSVYFLMFDTSLLDQAECSMKKWNVYGWNLSYSSSLTFTEMMPKTLLIVDQYAYAQQYWKWLIYFDWLMQAYDHWFFRFC